MQKRTISFFFFGLLTALLIATSAILYLVDWNKYRDTLAQLVSERLGVRVELAGDLGLQLLPRPSLTARAIRLSPLQTQFNDTIATADRIDMRLGLSAALAGNIELQSLSLEGVSVNLVETPTGWRIDGWPEEETNETSPENEASTGTLTSIDRFNLENSTVTATRLDGTSVTLNQINLSLSGSLPAGPLDWNGDVIIADTPLSISGRIVPVRTRDETSVRGVVDVAGSTIEVSGRITPKGNITGRLKVTGDSIRNLAQFGARTLDAEVPANIPSAPFTLDMQVDREGDISRLVSRQFSVADTHGVIDLTIAEKNSGYHLTGTTTLGVITIDETIFDGAVAPSAEAVVAVDPQDPIQEQALPLTGAIDITVEGIEYRGGLVQQINAVVGFNKGSPFLSQFSALLPGTSRLAFVASSGQMAGQVTFQSGRLPEMFKWMDIPLSEAVPSGRLTTANLSGNLRIEEMGWALSGIKGSVDTSTINAALSGSTSPFSLDLAQVDIDQLNLDAYWPEPVLPQDNEASSEPLPNIEVALNVGSLQWLHRSFTDLKTQILVSGNDLAVRDFAVKHAGGALAGTINLKGQGGPNSLASDIDGRVQYTKWAYPAVRSLSPEAGAVLTGFAGNEPITGVLSLSGPSNAVQAQVIATAGNNKAEFAGTLSIDNPLQFELQGTLNHTNALAMGSALPDVDMPKGVLPVALNINADGTESAVNFRASGQAAGHQLDVSGQYEQEKTTVDFSMSMPSGVSPELQQIADAYIGFFDVAQPSRARFVMEYTDSQISVSNVDINSGAMRISGGGSLTGNIVDGAFALSNIDVDRVLDKLSFVNDESSASSTSYGGNVALNIDNLTLFGQRLDAPAATLNARNGTANIILGDNAKLNGQPVTGTMALADTSTSTLTIKSAVLDAGKLLSAAGIAQGVSGLISTDINLSSTGATPRELMAGLSGEVSFNGGAGSMYFMAVPKIVEALSSTDSKTNFLQTIGGLLRSGTTGYTNLSGSLRFDGGVALIDEIVAAGDWGTFSVEGQANLVADLLNMKGSLDLARPQDTPAIPVVYQGSLTSPTTNWASAALERFAIAGIERRLRTKLFGAFDKAQSDNGDAQPADPGSAVVGAAFGLLERLRNAQAAKKKAEAEKASSEADKPNENQELD